MPERGLSIVSGAVVRDILEGQEDLVLSAVRGAYLAHAREQTRSPKTQPLYTNGGRFFAMPASIEDDRPIVGVKWVASYVANVAAGAERASAMLIVNDAATGRPMAIVDGTLISAKRTAAGAALALSLVTPPDSELSLALVGCGPINFEVYRFVSHLFPLTRVLLVDTDVARAEAFGARLSSPATSVSLDDALATADVVSFATNATVPHVAALPSRPMTVLHISLRDLAPEIIAGAYNIVDDPEHVCSARTSLHLASEQLGHQDFIRATIAQLLAGEVVYARPAVPTIVSPFGMAILDLAVLREVMGRVDGRAGVVRVADFGGTVF
jgi:ornithine cyclodeaminase